MKAFVFATLLFCTLTTAAQDYKLEGHEVKITKEIVFETGSDKLNAESTAALEIIKQYLTGKPYISTLRVEAHTGNAGNEATNQKLTEKRAMAICKKLVEMGVDCKRLIAVGFGGTKPVADNSTAEGKVQNRRISFFNAALRGRLIGGMPADGGGKVAGEVCQ